DGGMNFDFVEPPKPASAPPPGGGGDMLDFVDEATALTPKVKDERKRPPPPMIAPTGAKEETLSLSEPGGEVAPGGEELDPKKAEKERKKRERAERAANDREERARRKAAAGPGVLTTTI